MKRPPAPRTLDLGIVRNLHEITGQVGDDPGEVVTKGHPTTDADRATMHEQRLARLEQRREPTGK